jgi:hypothetical protein
VKKASLDWVSGKREEMDKCRKNHLLDPFEMDALGIFNEKDRMKINELESKNQSILTWREEKW